MPSTLSKRLFILRHGQALHNPRAEAAKDDGCSHERFLELMKQDDAMDAVLTELGKKQALCCHEINRCKLRHVDLIISSPLSRALQTADAVFPYTSRNFNGGMTRRVCVEEFREINGWLLNAKRRDRMELKNMFPNWDFSFLNSESDETWTGVLEREADCAERGYEGLRWIISKCVEENILLVSHGGLLRFTMSDHPHVHVVHDRSPAEVRFGNCELREYIMKWTEPVSGPIDITLNEVKNETSVSND